VDIYASSARGAPLKCKNSALKLHLYEFVSIDFDRQTTRVPPPMLERFEGFPDMPDKSFFLPRIL
jgi:hypothetical protein